MSFAYLAFGGGEHAVQPSGLFREGFYVSDEQAQILIDEGILVEEDEGPYGGSREFTLAYTENNAGRVMARVMQVVEGGEY